MLPGNISLSSYITPRDKVQVEGKLVVVAGGSRGLGKALAIELAAKGANLLLLARTHEPLLVARQDVQAACQSTKQIVDAIPIDLTNPDNVTEVLSTYHPPDILICTAGIGPGNSGSGLLLTDLPPATITSTLERTYYTSIFIVQSCLRRWRAEPVPRLPNSTRHILLTSSVVALGAVPGYDAYAPGKAAVRALGDTLRQELLLYGGLEAYRVHVCFPGAVLGEGQQELQGTSQRGKRGEVGYREEEEGGSRLGEVLERLERKSGMRPGMGVGEVARRVVRGMEEGRTYIPVDLRGEVLLNGMRGASPRFWTLYELVLGMVAVVFGWLVRWDGDLRMRRYGREQGWER